MPTISHGIYAGAVSPDEQWLAVGDNRGHINLWFTPLMGK